MSATPFTHTLKTLAEWGGPVNAGSGCLACVSHVLRGKTHWFARDAAPYKNCLDPAKACIKATQGGEITFTRTRTDISLGFDGSVIFSNVQVVTYTLTASGEWSVKDGGSLDSTYTGSTTFNGSLVGDVEVRTSTGSSCAPAIVPVFIGEGNAGHVGVAVSDDGLTTTYTPDGFVAYADGVGYLRSRRFYNTSTGATTTVNGDGAGLSSPWVLIGEDVAVYSGSIVHQKFVEETEGDADEEVAEAEEDTDIWGNTPDAQFPASWPWGGGWWDAWDGLAMSPQRQGYPNPASPILKHTAEGRDVLRAKLAIADTFYPGQGYALKWSEIVRALGYDVARSGTQRGRTVATRDRTITLEDPMIAPDDDLGSLDYDDASWDLLGYALLAIPSTPEDEDAPPTDAYRAADLVRRSRLRFGFLFPGAFTFSIRRVEVVDGEEPMVTTLSLTTAGTVGADGVNATPDLDLEPASRLGSVYVTIDQVQDADGKPVGGWLALGKVRDGWWGIRQLDHATLQADSQFYRRRVFTQVASVVASYIPDPENPPSEAEAACLASLPWMAFSQTQVWAQSIDPATGELPDWTLVSAEGSAGEAAWSEEVSTFDPPAYEAPTEGAGWTVEADSASAATESSPSPADALNGAIWAVFDRVVATPNPFFGGKTLAATPRSSGTTAFSYAGGDVQQSALIYVNPAAPGTSLQVVNVHASGA